MSKIPKAKDWEVGLGADAVERTKRIGQDSAHYRELVGIPQSTAHKQTSHETYIHSLGADVLRTMFSEEYEVKEKQKKSMMQSHAKAVHKIRRRVRVDDFEDGGLSVAIEQDWDTSGWNEELIAAGMESLIYIFYNFHNEATIPRKDRAILMIEKLLDRHKEADAYLRKNTESMMAQSVSRYIRDGKAAAVLDLLYVLNQTCERLIVELSNFNYAGKLTEMMLQESRLAAILIQHTFRSMKAKTRLKTTEWSHAYFGSNRSIYYRQIGVINARSNELRQIWRSFRGHYPKEVTQKVGGLRGPLHMNGVYVEKALSIIRQLVSDKAKLLAHSNREEIVRYDGCILLSTFLGTNHSPYAAITAMIVADVSQVVESFLPMLRSGIIFSAVRYLKFLRKLYRIGSDVLNRDTSGGAHGSQSKQAKKLEIIRAFLGTMGMIQHLALHAAGFYRARYGYSYERKDTLSGLQVTNYLTQLRLLEREKYTELIFLVPMLCPTPLLQEISTQVLTSSQPTILNHALRTLFYLASSECQELVTKEVIGLSGKLLIQLVQLLHHPCDHSHRIITGNIVVALFNQLCSTTQTRKALMMINIPQYLIPINQLYLQPAAKCHKPITSIEHMRGILVASMLSRQDEWNFMDPEALLYDMSHGHGTFEATFPPKTSPSTANNTKKTGTKLSLDDESTDAGTTSLWLREALLLNWLRTIKNCNYDGFNNHLTIADLVIMPTDPYRALAASRCAGTLCALEIIHALYHPQEEYYYESLPLHEAAAVVEIIESFTSYAQTAKMVFATELVRFLSKFLFLCKYLFLGKAMTTAQVMVVLNGVKASLVTLGRLCAAIQDNRDFGNRMSTWIMKTDLISTSLFFLNTLSTFDEKTDPEIIRLQKIVGISSLAFFHKLAHMLNAHYVGHDADVQDNPFAYGNAAVVDHTLRQSKRLTKQQSKGGEEGVDEIKMVMSVEDLFPSGEVTVQLFRHLKDIIHTRHEHYTRDLIFAEKLRAQYAHQERPVQNRLTSGSVIVATDAAATPGGGGGGGVNTSSSYDTMDDAVERRYQIINNTSPTGSPKARAHHRHGSVSVTVSPHEKNRLMNTSPSKAHHHDPYHATTSVTTHLNPRDEFLQVLDAMCKFLMELTKFSPGAYAAVQEWHIFDTLRRYLPPPLSGLNDASNAFLRHSMYVETRASVVGGTALSRSSIMMSRASAQGDGHGAASFASSSTTSPGKSLRPGTSTASMIGDSGASVQSHDSQQSALQAALTTAAKMYGANRANPAPGMGTMLRLKEDGEDGEVNANDNSHILRPRGVSQLQQSQSNKQAAVHDDVELIDLPSSYFQLCANLCRIADGTAACFAEGFLRRACDKAMALYVQLLAHRDPVRRTIVSSSRFPWEFRKLDFIACLRVIAATANFHHPRFGSTNDLIFSTPYDIILVCKTLITLKLKRTEELVLVAYDCLAVLAQDTYRVNQILEYHDVYEDIRQELAILTYHFPLRGVLACIRIIHGSTIGLTSPYLAKMIPKLREPLIKAARIYPQLDEAVCQANWTLTKSAMIYRTTFDASYKVEDEVNVDIEEFIRTGMKTNIQQYLQQPSMPAVSVDPDDSRERAAGKSDAAQTSFPNVEPANRTSSASLAERMHHTQQPSTLSLPSIIAQSRPFASSQETGNDADVDGSSLSFPGSPVNHASSSSLRHIPKQLFPATLPPASSSSDWVGDMSGNGHSSDATRSTTTKHVMMAGVWQELDASGDRPLIDIPGQYSHCGVTTHGSLRIPGVLHTQSHQRRSVDHTTTATATDTSDQHQQQQHNVSFRDMSASDMEKMLRRLDLSSAYGDDVLPISKLSARTPGLKQLVAERKGRAGFTEIQKTIVYPRDSILSSSGAAAANKRKHTKMQSGMAAPWTGEEKHRSMSSKPLATLTTNELPELRRTRPPPPSATAIAAAVIIVSTPTTPTTAPMMMNRDQSNEPWTTGAKQWPLRSAVGAHTQSHHVDNDNDGDSDDAGGGEQQAGEWTMQSFPSSTAVAASTPYVKSPDQLLARKKW